MYTNLATINLDALHSSPSELQTIDLAQLDLVNGGDFWSDLGYNALNLGKAAVNGVVNTANWLLPKTLDVNVGVAKAHWDVARIGTPFRDDPLSKVGHPPQRQIGPGAG